MKMKLARVKNTYYMESSNGTEYQIIEDITSLETIITIYDMNDHKIENPELYNEVIEYLNQYSNRLQQEFDNSFLV